jgi:GTP-binding protein HflX
MIHGNLTGIRKSWLAELEALYEYPVPKDVFLPEDLLATLAAHTARVNREISVYIARSGEVLDVTVGGLESVPLPALRLRRNAQRLAGVRCVHTHPGGDAHLSDVDLNALATLRLDAMAALGVTADGAPTALQAAFLGPRKLGTPEPWTTDLHPPRTIPQQEWMDNIAAADLAVLQGEDAPTLDPPERALLLSIDSEDSLAELAALTESAGALPVATAFQNREKPDNATYFGKGRAEQAALELQALHCDLAIVDDELSGAQTRNLEEVLGVRVIDRTMLILDIFAQRALSREGRLQVELAQLSYQLPRLAGEGVSLSRLGGGIGTRGPGETKLEVSRRRIRERMTDLKRSLEDLERQRGLQRVRRQKSDLPIVAIVGYTNTGKSTLLNALTDAGVLTEDQLFATLDPVTRRYQPAEGVECLLVDTVGFIRKLPTALIEAFHATLEEAALADLLLIVGDAAAPDRVRQRDVVGQVLQTLGAGDKPVIEVINKTDVAAPGLLPAGAVPISAKTGAGLDVLAQRVAQALQAHSQEMTLEVPYAMGQVRAFLHERAQVLDEAFEAQAAKLTVRAPQAVLERALHMLK